MGMPFRQKNYLIGASVSTPQYMYSTDANGRFIKTIDNRELPNPETFKTSNMLKAGKDLGQPINPIYKVEIGENNDEPQEIGE